MPTLSVVMLSYNRKAELRDGLRRILAERPPFEIEVIVVDNASKDGTPLMVETEFPAVRLIALPENIGVAGYNRGFAVARGEFVLVLDDDSCPAPGAMAGLERTFAAHPDAAVVALDVRHVDAYREADSPADLRPAHGSSAAPAYQMGFNGAGAGIRRSVLEEVGGYAEEFFLYWNEQDLAIRILAAGHRILHSPELVSLHRYSPVNREARRGPFYYTRNLYWLLWKHLPAGRMAAATLRLLYLSLFHSLEQRTTVYLQATWDAWRHGGEAWRRRRPVPGTMARRLRIPLQHAFVVFR